MMQNRNVATSHGTLGHDPAPVRRQPHHTGSGNPGNESAGTRSPTCVVQPHYCAAHAYSGWYNAVSGGGLGDLCALWLTSEYRSLRILHCIAAYPPYPASMT